MMNWKGFVRKQPCSDVKVLPHHSSGGPEENHEKLSQDTMSADRDLNPGPPEYEAGALTTRPRLTACL
jgi:hypothetical protein